VEILCIGTYGESPMPVDEDYKDKIVHATACIDDNMVMISVLLKERTYLQMGIFNYQ